MPNIVLLTEKINSIDITQIVNYRAKINDLCSIKKAEAPMYLRDFIIAYDASSVILAQIIQYDIQAKTVLESAEAIAYLDKASDYLKDHNIKDTAEARKQYVNINEEYIKAADLKAKTEALVCLLKSKLVEFRMAHDDVKKMCYDEVYQTPHEGF